MKLLPRNLVHTIYTISWRITKRKKPKGTEKVAICTAAADAERRWVHPHCSLLVPRRQLGKTSLHPQHHLCILWAWASWKPV